MHDVKHSNERRADHAVRQAVDNIQSRFLERVGDRVARGLSLRELSEELIIESLQLCQASYGCVMRTDDHGQLELDATVLLQEGQHVTRLQHPLMNNEPDATVRDVMASLKPVFSNNGTEVIKNLPAEHPDIRSFALCPVYEQGDLKALLFVANATPRFDLAVVRRLQSMLNAFIRVHINSIINRGINNIIASVGQTNRQLVNLLEASFNAVITVDDSMSLTAVNPACEKLLGIDTSSALGTDLSHFFSHDVIQTLKEQAADVRYAFRIDNRPPPKITDTTVRRTNGHLIPVQITTFHARVHDCVYTTVIINDLSGQASSASELESTVVQYRTLTQLAPVGIIKLDEQWLCEYANTMWCHLSGRTLNDNLGSGWIEVLHEQDQTSALMQMREALIKGDTWRQVMQIRTDSDRTLASLHRVDPNNVASHSSAAPLWVSFHATALFDTLQRLTGSLVVVMDITEQYEAEQRLKQIAHHDALTGLPNRARFLELLNQSIELRAPHEVVCLLLIDLDGFKAVNDTLGHDTGDALLQQVAHRLKVCIPDYAIAARLGGDEFTVILQGSKYSIHPSELSDAIVNTIKQPFIIQHEEVYISASIGIATISGSNRHNSVSPSAMIKQADIALYRAKLTGRSRSVFFTPQLDQEQRSRSRLINALRRAVDRQDFELYYQPQVLIKENKLLGFEALLRWPGADQAAMKPDQFVSVLEETGLINELGEWAISQACGQHRIWLRRGLISPATTMSVNVSVKQLSSPDFVERVLAIIERHSMRPDSLILEITESTVVQTIESDIIHRIKDTGVQISLDDFGTGYSSLACLSQLPLDHLKIDRSFISDIDRYPHAKTIIKSIIALASTLCIRVIAEGVENQKVLDFLAKEGCEAYQGYFFSQPLPALDMAKKLSETEKVRLDHYMNFINLVSGHSVPPPSEPMRLPPGLDHTADHSGLFTHTLRA